MRKKNESQELVVTQAGFEIIELEDEELAGVYGGALQGELNGLCDNQRNKGCTLNSGNCVAGCGG